ncbi:MAG: SusC/RagA family TonB-linked outer membrane protein [Cyclobacteriaceae bacterium]
MRISTARVVVTVLLFGLPTLVAIAQSRTVTGTVTAEGEGELPGVNILVKGTTQGTVTDIEGNYRITVSNDEAILVFSAVGYASEEVTVGNQSTLDMVLLPDIKSLSEVVVVGYGTQERRDLTGAVSSVDASDFENMAINSVEQGLQGRVAGVNVVQQSGQPGAAMQVQIRGVGSIGNSEPLYVIDGIPVVNDNGATGEAKFNALNSINPSDIESIEILKDASAAAIYGARAANGVVLITTKRGKAGEAKIQLDAYTGIQEAWRLLELTDINGYKEISDELTDNAGLPRVVALQRPEELVNLTDWQEEMFDTAPINNVNLSVSGGNEGALFSVSANYMNQEGILRNTDFERLSLRVNTDFKKGRFKFGQTMAFSRTVANDFTANFFQIIHFPPNRPIFDENNVGGYAGNRIIDEQDANNPVGQADLFTDRTTRFRVIGNIYGEYEIMEGLTYRLNLGGDFIYGNRYQFNEPFQFGDRRTELFASINERNAFSVSPLIENTLNYSKTFGNHQLGVLVGYTRQSYSERSAQSQGRNTVNTISVLNGVNEVPAVSGGLQEFALVSYLGRLTYSFADRYLLTANIRRDGSSRFSPGNKFGVFPSASVGWRISEEGFMDAVDVVSDLKLRGSWGQTGFQEIGNYGFQAELRNTLNYLIGGELVTGVAQRDLAANTLVWETSTQTNFGLDIGLFNNQVLINADYFIKETEDILIPVPPTPSTGVRGGNNSPTLNVGSVRNEGLELALTYRKSVGDLQYSVTGNFATLENEFVSLGGGQPITSGNVNVTRVTRIDEGLPIGSFFGFRTDGIFQTQEEVEAHADQPNAEPGDIRFKDLNGDNVINSDDREYIGDPIPDITYGLSLSASYKGFDLNMFMQGVAGVELYYGYRYFAEGMLRPFNFEQRTLNRWTGPGTSNEIPRAIGGDPANNTRESDRFIGDGSFLRMRNLTLGYTVPFQALENFGNGFLSNVRIYATAQNLFTITNYEGYDPEIASQNQNPEQASRGRGIDNGQFPQARTYMLGAQITF